MIKRLLFLVALVVYGESYAQPTLDDCQRMARENYPAIRRYGLISQGERYRLSEISKGWIPQASLSARATYQSDVTGLPIAIPGIDIAGLSKFQYQGTLDVNQTLWDGGAMRAQRIEARASSDADRASLEVEMYRLREQVNNLYFGIMLSCEQLALNETYIKNLEANLSKMRSMAANGTASASDVDAVLVGIVQARQERVNIEYSLEGYRAMLELMIGERLVLGDGGLQAPEVVDVDTAVISRPELSMYDAQGAVTQSKLVGLNASTMPRFSAYVQGGIGAPGLNMLNSNFGNWAMGGLRMSWNFGAFYGKSDLKKQIEISRRNIENAREVFLYNVNLQKTQQQKALENYRETISSDDKIIALRESVERAAAVKMEQGVIAATDYMREALAAQQARQNKSLHRMQLLMEIYKLKTTLNN